jgi:tetratricopeptide (TPR) repeat protein
MTLVTFAMSRDGRILQFCDSISFLLQAPRVGRILGPKDDWEIAMSATLVLSALLAAAQLTSTPGAEPSSIEQREVAYEQIAAGRADEAIRAIEAALVTDPDDPALLINLGAAYARKGDPARAAHAFQAAIDSDTRYELELADGSWSDSRHAARRALETLQRSSQLAALED